MDIWLFSYFDGVHVVVVHCVVVVVVVDIFQVCV